MRRSPHGLPPIDSSSFRGEISLGLGYFRKSLYSPFQKRGATGQEVGKSTAVVMGPVALGNRYRTGVQDRCTGQVYRTGVQDRRTGQVIPFRFCAVLPAWAARTAQSIATCTNFPQECVPVPSGHTCRQLLADIPPQPGQDCCVQSLSSAMIVRQKRDLWTVSYTTHIRLKEIFCVSGTGEECLLSNTSNCVGKFILY